MPYIPLVDGSGFGARVAKLVDALDLGSSGVTCESSSLSSRKVIINEVNNMQVEVVKLEGLARRLNVVVPAQRLQEAYA